jgi:hypothetical protein
MRAQPAYYPPQYYEAPRRREPSISPGKIIFGILSVVSMLVTPIAAKLIEDSIFAKTETTVVMKKDTCVDAASHWAGAKEIGTHEAFEEHIRQFPMCAFAGLARQRIDATDAQTRAAHDADRQRQEEAQRQLQQEQARLAEADAIHELQRFERQLQQQLQQLQQEADNQRAASEAEARRLQQELFPPQQYVVAQGWIGVGVQSLTADLAEALEVREGSGVLVTDVRPNSPAALIGLQPGDLIWAVDDCGVGSVEEVRAQIANMTPGSAAWLSILRNGNQFSILVVVGQKPA